MLLKLIFILVIPFVLGINVSFPAKPKDILPLPFELEEGGYKVSVTSKANVNNSQPWIWFDILDAKEQKCKNSQISLHELACLATFFLAALVVSCRSVSNEEQVEGRTDS
ncbi:uncharacterized protein LOC134723573 [Mytilus trossulus]|uniref:uncharacterized protein LOC134723573 n=1 Tax=Mytilus trossulus TaxID=6551 RepID=UPI0030042BC4